MAPWMRTARSERGLGAAELHAGLVPGRVEAETEAEREGGGGGDVARAWVGGEGMCGHVVRGVLGGFILYLVCIYRVYVIYGCLHGMGPCVHNWSIEQKNTELTGECGGGVPLDLAPP